MRGGVTISADPGFDAVGKALDGDDSAIVSLHQAAGDLVIFQGRHTLHRVTPVKGLKPRVIAVLSCDPEPGKILHKDTRMTFYGRAA